MAEKSLTDEIAPLSLVQNICTLSGQLVAAKVAVSLDTNPVYIISRVVRMVLL